MAHIKMNHINYSSSVLYLTLCAVALAFISTVQADGTLSQNLQKLKINAELGEFEIPNSISTIRVELNNNVVKPGDPIPARNIKDISMAKLSWDSGNSDTLHTIMLLDLDRKAKLNGTHSIYNQYTNINIPGNNVANGQAIVTLEAPVVPCQPNSKHRILMLVFYQSQAIDIGEIAYMASSTRHPERRENVKLNEVVNRHRLSLVAANVFQAIGEKDGICSGSTTLNSFQSLSSILIAMVIAKAALSLAGTRSPLY